MAITILTKENWHGEVLEAEQPVLVDFWAAWCGPCRMLAPVVEQLAQEYADTVRFGKVNVDEQPELAEQFGISGIPTLLLFQSGRVIDRAVGVQPKEKLKELLKQAK